MPTMFTHPVIPIALAAGLGQQQTSGRLIMFGALFSILPDFDVIAFVFGIPYSLQWGHRGFTHSLFFALLFSALLSWAFASWLKTGRIVAFGFLFVACSCWTQRFRHQIDRLLAGIATSPSSTNPASVAN